MRNLKGNRMTTPTDISTLGDALPAKMKFVREVVIPAYQEIGPSGAFAIAMINQDLTNAVQALTSGDVVKMLEALAALEGIAL